MNISSISNTNFTGGKIRFEAFKVYPTYDGDRCDEEYLGIKTVNVDDIVAINHNYIDIKKPADNNENTIKRGFRKTQKEPDKTERLFYKGNATEMMDHYRRLKETPGDTAILECNDKGKKFKFYFDEI